MNIYRAIQIKKSVDDDTWWDTFLSNLTLILSLSPQLKETPLYHAEIETAANTLRTLIHRRLQLMEVKKRTNYLIMHETNAFIESIQQVQQLVLHQHPAYKAQLTILTNHADRLVDALMTYDIGGVEKKNREINPIKRSDDLHHSSFSQFDTVGRKLMKTISSLRPVQQQQQQHHYKHSHKDRRQLNIVHGSADRSTKASIINLFTRKSSRSSLKELFHQHQHKKQEQPCTFENDNVNLTETLLPDKLYDSFYHDHSHTQLLPERRQIKGRRSSPAMSSLISLSPPTAQPSPQPTHMIQRHKPQHIPQHIPPTEGIPIPSSEHYYDDPLFFSESPSVSPSNKGEHITPNKTNSSKASTICSSDSSYFSAKSTSLHSFVDPIDMNSRHNSPASSISTSAPLPRQPPLPARTVQQQQSDMTRSPVTENSNRTEELSSTHKRKTAIRQLSGPPPLHQPGQSKKSREKDGSPLYHVYDKNGQKIMVLEILAGKPKVVAATREQLFLKLADESPQDFDYVDVYLLSHASFTTSFELFDDLIARFHLEPCPGHQDYFQQWQRRIQIKTLKVLKRWIKLQYQDFMHNPSLLLRLEEFCDHDLVMAGFITEASRIKDAMYAQTCGYHTPFYHGNAYDSPCAPPPPSNSPFTTAKTSSSSGNPSGETNDSPATNTTPPDSPLLSGHHNHPQYQQSHFIQYYHHHHSNHHPYHHHHQRNNVITSPFLSLDTKDIAKYLTLADYHLLKQIKPRDYLDGHWRDTPYNDLTLSDIESRYDYIGIMTKRANMMNHWVIHELASAKSTKQRRMILRKLIETSKLCLDWNNFHTSMVLTMGLLSHPVQKMEEVWQSLPSRDKTTFNMLEKLVDVSHNMAHYRQALKEDGHLHPNHIFHKKQDTFSINSSKSGSLPSSNKDHLNSGPSFFSSTSNHHPTSSLPTLLFFPMVLKDLTFLMDGNPAIYGQHRQNKCDDGNDKPVDTNIDDDTLVNFAKFSGLAHYVTKVVQSTMGNYWFAMDLERIPTVPAESPCCCYALASPPSDFMKPTNGISYSPTRSSISTLSSTATSPPVADSSHYPHHHSSPVLTTSPSSPYFYAPTQSLYHYHQHFNQQIIKPQQHYQPLSLTLSSSSSTSLSGGTSSSSSSASSSSSLDLVADIIEERISRVAMCYGDLQCEAQLSQVLKSAP